MSNRLLNRILEFRTNVIAIASKPYYRLPNTSSLQDVLKTIALISMTIDHLGLFFFDGEQLFRILGRPAMPIWLYFVGYNFNHSKFFSRIEISAAVLLCICKWYTVHAFLPMNILCTTIICRLILKSYSLTSAQYIIPMLTAFIGLSSITSQIFDYGAIAWIVALWGYCAKRCINNIFTLFIAMLLSVLNADLGILSTTLTLLTVLVLHYYKPLVLNITGLPMYSINIAARYSLYIYLLHMIAFMSLS